MPSDKIQTPQKAETPLEEIASILAVGVLRRNARNKTRLTGLKSQLTSNS